MMAIKSGEITKVPLAEVAGKLKCVDPEAGIIQEVGNQVLRRMGIW